jgi:hypothetical protein
MSLPAGQDVEGAVTEIVADSSNGSAVLPEGGAYRVIVSMPGWGAQESPSVVSVPGAIQSVPFRQFGNCSGGATMIRVSRVASASRKRGPSAREARR